ncbi:unnamed protein product [Orchesella dallaii]|uniref:Uncharacterized protein n=1 Tax=Orchesella dallaii TaxID=48710 RepID=A0ABP1RW55_9HEXA
MSYLVTDDLQLTINNRQITDKTSALLNAPCLSEKWFKSYNLNDRRLMGHCEETNCSSPLRIDEADGKRSLELQTGKVEDKDFFVNYSTFGFLREGMPCHSKKNSQKDSIDTRGGLANCTVDVRSWGTDNKVLGQERISVFE